MMKIGKIKLIVIFLCLILLFSFVFSAFFVKRPSAAADERDISFFNATEETATYAKGMAVVEASSGRILFQKNCNGRFPMASTTKIMTALVALENAKNLDETFKVDDRSIGVEGTSLYLQKGEEKTLRELLYGLMLPSGNDAAVAIALRISKTEEEFVELMNKKAKSLGLENTHFSNPHGLDAEGHYTSAFDLAKITACAMENPTFCEIVKTKNVTVSGNEMVQAKLLKNKNKLLWQMEECEGVKTGFTDNAKRCFVASAKKDGMRLICVVLNCGPMFEESKRLLQMGFENYSMVSLLGEYSKQPSVEVENGVKTSVETFSKRKFEFPLSKDEIEIVKTEIDLPSKISAPVKKEQELGKISIKLGNETLFVEKIFSTSEIESTKFMDKLEKITGYWNL